MRLGQLARKLSIRQTDIVDFLAKSINVEIANESNARLDDEHVQAILQQYAPSLLNQKAEELESIEEAVVPILEIIEEKEATQVSVASDIVDSSRVETVVEEGSIEVIKAPKVDLPGLKVLGKIELPEPKKKEALPAQDGTVEEPQAKAEVDPKPRMQRTRNNQENRREKTNRSSINPIALQREREARAAEEKRKEDAIKEKEKRTEYYLKRVKINTPTKAARLYTEQVEEFTTAPKKEEPKTLLGKFFRWLTTA